MDGLTIRNGQSLIDSGKTASEIKQDKFNVSRPVSPGQTDPSEKTFSDTLKDAVGTVNALQKDADVKAQALATGKTSDIPEVMMASEKADIALRMMMQVRNKMIEAYQEMMKMQV